MNSTAVLLQKFSGEQGERVDIQKLYGYIGLFTFLGLWWVGKIELLASFSELQGFDLKENQISEDSH